MMYALFLEVAPKYYFENRDSFPFSAKQSGQSNPFTTCDVCLWEVLEMHEDTN
jgi:hypothetical protein